MTTDFIVNVLADRNSPSNNEQFTNENDQGEYSVQHYYEYDN